MGARNCILASSGPCSSLLPYESRDRLQSAPAVSGSSGPSREATPSATIAVPANKTMCVLGTFSWCRVAATGWGFSNQHGHLSNSQTPEGVVKGSVSHGGNRPSRSGSWLRASHDPATIMLYARPPLSAVDRGLRLVRRRLLVRVPGVEGTGKDVRRATCGCAHSHARKPMK